MVTGIVNMVRLESIMTRDHASGGTPLPEHLPQIIHEEFRFFIGCKMPAGIMFRLEHEV